MIPDILRRFRSPGHIRSKVTLALDSRGGLGRNPHTTAVVRNLRLGILTLMLFLSYQAIVAHIVILVYM
jgi:hypothetical protein